ncbi:MAG: hypothetical protein N0C84_00910 [Candidatus Thiodiazotropha taylori]|uniref:Uncharacterized protein n=1 Tax=Candidatus Thiodiazotropha taylori TaxID=2792791 RepID=A0A9E4KA53_9GAMM|nr:hypothetical protein [Candidatus Thiodiazotropha taylori]MCW4255005.1 hypothetical protein [Candidatus Thiodiazotropha taylori]
MSELIEYIGGIPYKKENDGSYTPVTLVTQEVHDINVNVLSNADSDLQTQIDVLRQQLDSEMLEDIINDSDFQQHLQDWFEEQRSDSDRMLDHEHRIEVLSDRLDDVENNLVIDSDSIIQTAAQNRHMIYKVATIDATDYAGMMMPIEQVIQFMLAPQVASDAAFALDAYNQIVEIRPDGSWSVLTDYFVGLEVKPENNNPNNTLMRWSGTAWSEEFNVATRNRTLLQGGFLLTEGTLVGDLQEYIGSLIGEPSQSYWYDTANDIWYDADQTTELIRF